MELEKLKQVGENEWMIEPHGKMRVPGIIFATEELVRAMDNKVYEQVVNVATLPGIQKASMAMPDAHWGYGFPVGGVAAFDPKEGGVVSAGGVGFDISCGVRCLQTGLKRKQLEQIKYQLADTLFRDIPAGLGSTGKIRLDDVELNRMLQGGAQWAVERGFGKPEDLERIEERGKVPGAVPANVSEKAKNRMRDEVGTLGSGNHYLEVQEVAEIYHPAVAKAFGIEEGDIVVSIHCGSRGLGHQIGTDYLREMLQAAQRYGIELPDRELACAPITSPEGEKYLGAMRAAINVALANRQVITHLARKAFSEVVPNAELRLLYDVSHNTCKVERHKVDGEMKEVYIHRKGATRAWGPGHPDLPPVFRDIGQPVLIGGSMGTCSYILVGTAKGMELSFGSSCHGAGRSMSRSQALKKWKGQEVVRELEARGILIRSPSMRGVAEEAPEAYKDVSEVVEAADKANISKTVAKLVPIITIKG
ncbi:MAG TPA: RtcB family protein [Fimbriimonadales bacterium]|nr:RtcB family protein [Fimbriimonadales bacterium]